MSHHLELLGRVLKSPNPSEHLVVGHNKVIYCFSAELTDEEAGLLSGMEGVISVFRTGKIVQETNTIWSHLNLTVEERESGPSCDVIIGIVDQDGINPALPSFASVGFGSPPDRWKCVSNVPDFECNNKIVAALSYGEGDPKPIMDGDDHGNICAASAAGNAVTVDGYGICSGSLPSARIAIYRVDRPVDLEKGIMRAIRDRVDVISVSLARNYRDKPSYEDFIRNDIGLGSYLAMVKGIPLCASAGNMSGWGSIENYYPWTICCGASTSPRKYTTKIRFENGAEIEGFSRNEFPDTELHDVVFASDCSENGLLRENEVRNKIIAYDYMVDGVAAFDAGAAGVLIFLKHEVSCEPFPLPAVCFKEKESKMIEAALKDENFESWLEQCQILRSVVQEPTLASLSGQGPTVFAPCVLKPDICAPGVDIVTPTVMDDNKRVSCCVGSGTSYSTAIVAGAIGYLKTHHPDWSPAALRSSLMTTASQMRKQKSIDALGFGAGLIDPMKAKDPGLIYDIAFEDYFRFLVGLGYSPKVLDQLTSEYCTERDALDQRDLNMPSFCACIPSSESLAFKREVTFVGSQLNMLFNVEVADVSHPDLLDIEVDPKQIFFEHKNVKRSFELTVTLYNWEGCEDGVISANLIWKNELYSVRSPIVIYKEEMKVTGAIGKAHVKYARVG